MTTKVYSLEQIDIVTEYKETNNDIIVQATAGSGKSFMILELLKITSLRKSSLLCAFNKSIKEELENKVPSNTDTTTIHSLSYKILRRNYFQKYKLNEFKTFSFCRKYIVTKDKKKKKEVYWFQISKVIDLCRMNLVTDRLGIESICDRYNISLLDFEIDDVVLVWKKIEKYNNTFHDEFMIDFTDMLWLTYKKVESVSYPKYDVVFCDELQDLNPLQRVIVERCIKRNGRFVGVGDDQQLIYNFQGSNLDSFNYFKNKPNTKLLPLSTTYRCSKEVVREANKVFKGIVAYEENIEGEVRNGTIEEVKSGDFILCRNNLPLIECFISLLKQEKKCHILGKDFGDELISILNKINFYSSYEDGVENILNEKYKQLKSKGVKDPKKTNQYFSLLEKLEIIEILMFEFKTIDRVSRKINEIYTNKETDDILLMTIHKSKGLEARRVFVKNINLIPSKFAETEQELYSERCLKFVCITRAKESLIYID